MPKGQVTEEDLRRSIKSLGGFGALASEGKPRRDSPFRDTATETSAPEPHELGETQPPSSENTHHTPPAEEKVLHISPQVADAPQTTSLEAPEKDLPKRRTTRRSMRARAVAPPGARKADVYSERITLQLSPEMRDRAEQLAKELQRRRTVKDERITANTVMRVAVNLLLNQIKLSSTDVVNNEEELYQCVKEKLLKG